MADHSDIAAAYARELTYAETRGLDTRDIVAAIKAHNAAHPDEPVEYVAPDDPQVAEVATDEAPETAAPRKGPRGRR